MDEPYEYDLDDPDSSDPDDDDRDCYWCGGDGYVECDDPIQCTRLHDKFGDHECSSCGGSGLRKDMTIW
jgi:hypothetical protein